jgi:hypothetical protein
MTAINERERNGAGDVTLARERANDRRRSCPEHRVFADLETLAGQPIVRLLGRVLERLPRDGKYGVYTGSYLGRKYVLGEGQE